MKQFDSYALDVSNECLWRDGAQILLPRKPYSVLRYLVENPGRLITHDELLDALWPETYVQPQVIRTYVQELRKLLDDDARQPRFIQTLPKRGYCFVALVTEGAGPETAQVASGTAAREAETERIVDREEEMLALVALAKAAKEGKRQVVFVTGESGIGKTALVEAFCGRVAGLMPVTVGYGQCVEGLGAKEDHYPVMEVLCQLCEACDSELVCRVLGRSAPAWLPERRREAETAEDRTAKERMPGDLCRALEEVAAEELLLLVFEDLHWADEATLDLISALARRHSAAKLMLLATCRPQEASSAHPFKRLKSDLLLHRLSTEMVLPPLAKSSVTEMLRRQLGQAALPSGLEDFVFRYSEGNPLFVISILEHLIAERCLARRGGEVAAQWQQVAQFGEAESSVPHVLTQMIELEVERLSAREQSILEAGSLISVAFPAWAVAAALEADETETEEACDELARRLHFLRRGGQDELPGGRRSTFYVFAHGLYREVLYQRQSEARRGMRHNRIALRLGELFVGQEACVAREMAAQFELAGNWKGAVAALRAAAGHAHERQAFAEAEELLERCARVVEQLSEADRREVMRAMEGGVPRVRRARHGAPQKMEPGKNLTNSG